MGRKCGLFAYSTSSPGSGFAELEVKSPERLRPCPRIFPFCGDYRRRLVRSRLPPEINAVDFDQYGPSKQRLSDPCPVRAFSRELALAVRRSLGVHQTGSSPRAVISR